MRKIIFWIILSVVCCWQVRAATFGPWGRIRKTATYIVAASDSKNRASADYYCDGTADNVQIQAALDALPDTGGEVVLLDGTFNIVTTIDYNDFQKISGTGTATILKLTAGSNTNILKNVDQLNGNSGTVLSDFKIDGNKANNVSTSRGIWHVKGSNLIFENLTVQDCEDTGLSLNTVLHVKVSSCSFTGNQYGMYTVDTDYLLLENSDFDSQDDDGAALGTSGNENDFMSVNNCSFSNNGDHGAHIDSINSVISNCIFSGNTD